MTPSVGRAVHYHPKHVITGPLHATITAVTDFGVELMVMGTMRGEFVQVAITNGTDTGLFFMGIVPFSEEPKVGHWSWPPRVG